MLVKTLFSLWQVELILVAHHLLNSVNLEELGATTLAYVSTQVVAMGVVTETGVFSDVAHWIDDTIGSVWVLGIVSGLLSGVVDSFTIAMSDISLYEIKDIAMVGSYDANFMANGAYWKIIAYCTAVGGCLLSVGSVSGLALMKMEQIGRAHV